MLPDEQQPGGRGLLGAGRPVALRPRLSTSLPAELSSVWRAFFRVSSGSSRMLCRECRFESYGRVSLKSQAERRDYLLAFAGAS